MRTVTKGRSTLEVGLVGAGSNVLRLVRKWLAPIADPRLVVAGARGYPGYAADWRRYARLPQAEPIRFRDAHPQLHDRTTTTAIDPHYFYSNGWAIRRILAQPTRRHVDVGSQTVFANLLGATVPVVFVDYRPVVARLSGLHSVGASLLNLPFRDRSVPSLSCLHVIEHVGLGRYGDALDPMGTRKAMAELSRVLAVGGNLFVAIPVGQSRLCFNAHRIHEVAAIRAMAPDLDLVEFSGVTDDGDYVEQVPVHAFDRSQYACGLFWFRRGQA